MMKGQPRFNPKPRPRGGILGFCDRCGTPIHAEDLLGVTTGARAITLAGSPGKGWSYTIWRCPEHRADRITDEDVTKAREVERRYLDGTSKLYGGTDGGA